MSHVPFPSIEKYANMLQQLPFVFGQAVPANLAFTGTVKLHGTHADLRIEKDGGLHVQSRNRVLTLESDNDGCARWFHEREPHVRLLLKRVAEALGARTFVLAGEFCGRGIQSKVALCALPRMFVVFAARALGAEGSSPPSPWLPLAARGTPAALAGVCDGLEEHGLYCIARFPTFTLQLDVKAPEEALRRAEELTEAVDRECPFARQLGILGAGEGIVWTCDLRPGDTGIWFKTKGAAHTAPRAPGDATEKASIGACAGVIVTERRLEQGVEYLREMGIADDAPASTGTFARWVTDDACREERDTIAAEIQSEAGRAALRKNVNRLAAMWFKAHMCAPQGPRQL